MYHTNLKKYQSMKEMNVNVPKDFDKTYGIVYAIILLEEL